MSEALDWAAANPVGAAIIAVFALVAFVIVLRILRAVWRGAGRVWRNHIAPRPVEDILTVVAAGIATAVAGQGMWQFLERVLPDVPVVLRGLMFAFVEIAVITSAVRARRNMREKFSAGVDGLAVWVLTVVSAVLAATEAGSLPEVLFRLAAPLVAAWLWERGMAIERVRLTGRTRIKWRITPERAMVWLGLAETSDRTATEVDAHRRLTRVALARKRVRALQATGASERQMRRALAKLDRVLDRAVEHTGLAADQDMQMRLLDQISALSSASLVAIEAPGPWPGLDHPAVTGQQRHSEARELAASLDRWTDVTMTHRDPEVSAAITSLAAYVTGRHLPPPGSGTTSGTPSGTITGTAPLVPPPVPQAVPPVVPLFPFRRPPTGTAGGTSAGTRAVPTRRRMTWTSSPRPTATGKAAMRDFWAAEIAAKRVPSGADLARIGGCDPSYGRRMRRAWLNKIDGRTRRALTKETA